MSESGKLTDKAAELANQAMAAAGPVKDKATELASKAASAAGPIAAQARDRASALAGQAATAAGPLMDKAAKGAAAGLETLAEGLDRVTGGKYHDTITSVSSKLGERLDPGHGDAATEDETQSPSTTDEPS